jgi:hypothetical protein
MSDRSHTIDRFAEDDQAVGVEQQPVAGLELDILPDRARVRTYWNSAHFAS